MTKNITKTTLAILALGMSAPAMAADGTPGTTSTGSFTASVTVTTPPAPTLHIYGLADIFIGNFVANNAGQVNFPVHDLTSNGFCAVRSDGGDVKITVTQNAQSGTDRFYLETGSGPTLKAIGAKVAVTYTGFSGYDLANGGSNVGPASLASCVGTNGHLPQNWTLGVTPTSLNGGFVSPDTYSGLFTLTVSVP